MLKISACFPLRVSQVWLTFRSLIHVELSFVSGVRRRSKFIPLHVDLEWFQHQLLKRLTLLLTEIAWHPCPKSSDHKCKGSVLFSWFYPTDPPSSQHPTVLNTCGRVELLKLGRVSALILFGFFKAVSTILDTLHFHINFRISWLISMKRSQLGFWQGLQWICKSVGSIAILTMVGLPIRGCGTASHLLKSPLISFNNVV